VGSPSELDFQIPKEKIINAYEKREENCWIIWKIN
jgi:hypothetical protein